MSNEATSQSELEIVRSIRSSTDAEVARVAEAARAQADSETARTQAEARAIEAEILAAAQETVRRHRTRELATAAVESRRMALWAREKRIAAVFARIEEDLRGVRDDPARYRQSLLALAVEAVFAAGGEAVRLQLAERDRPVADDVFIEAVREGARGRAGREVAIETEFVPDAIPDGCVASTPDGRVFYDNTYGRRLERNRRALRMAILREIEQGHE